MSATALPAGLLYGRLLATAAARLAVGGAPGAGAVRSADGRLSPLPFERWLRPAEGPDEIVLARVEGPALDIGCGPGRHVAALRSRGCRALGIDLSPVAVSITRGRGAEAVLGSIFDDVVDAGAWQAALLLDGNVGIGGAPEALLGRARELLVSEGAVIAEFGPPGTATRRTRVRLEAGDTVSEWFAWADVGIDDAGALAAATDLSVDWTLNAGGRWFAALRRP